MKGISEILQGFRPKNLLVSIRETFGQSGRYYRFGREDNAPNLIIEAVNDSPTARMCVDKLNQFVFGQGFVKAEIKDFPVNPKTNIEEFTRGLIEYLNYSDGFVIQHKFNKVGESARKYIIPIQYVRKRYQGDFIFREGLGDQSGTFLYNYNDIIVPNWDKVKLMSLAEIRQMVDSQIKKYGEQLGAFQYCYIPRVGQLYDKYPVPNHFSGMPTLRADAGLSLAEENAVANSFKPQFVITSPVLDRNQDDENGSSEYDRFIDEVERATSPDGSNIILLESNNSEKITITPLSNTGRMDEAEKATERIQKSICRMFGVPPVIVGIDTQGKLGDNQELVNKFKLFNLTLEDRRKFVYRALTGAFNQYGDNYSEADFELKPLELFDYLPPDVVKTLNPKQMEEIYQLPEAEAQGIGGPEPITEENSLNEAFTNLSGRQLQGIQRTVRKFNKGELTKSQAAQLLMSGFGMTEEQVEDWLVDEASEYKALNAESYSDYGSGVRGNAKRALEYADKNGWGSCGTPVGKQRANQLASGEAISLETIKRMYSYLSRAADDYDGGSLEKCGNLMYLAWGGKAGLNWSRSKLRELGEIDD